MLIRFNVENFLSFRDEVEFSMIAGSERRLPDHYIKHKDFNILKGAVIYGPNASGKSNLVKAIHFAQQFILNGFDGVESLNKHFRLDPEVAKKPTRFEFEIKAGKTLYSYGFTLQLEKQVVHEEFLYRIEKNRNYLIFERDTGLQDKIQVKYGLKASNNDFARFEIYAKDLKHDQLLLQQVNTRNLEEVESAVHFIDVFQWFKYSLVIIYPDSRYKGLTFPKTNKKFTEILSKFLKSMDTGITKALFTEVDIEEELGTLRDTDRKKILNDLRKKTIKFLQIKKVSYAIWLDDSGKLRGKKLVLVHTDKQGKQVLFDCNEESDGTNRLMDLIPALDILSTLERVFVVDELDRSLHPHLSEAFIKLFFKQSRDIPNQLIVTTHESSLQNLRLLRRDEIWFIERQADGHSELYSLNEFKVRPDKELRKDYLIGRYGAIPSIELLETSRLN
ncbi:MAG: AAA family ATPase [Bacteroidales bacterium]